MSAERFYSNVAPGQNGCLLWTKGTTGKGYGQFLPFGRRGKKYYAHRFAWESANGPIPHGMVICHRCDTPRCVNVDHLFVGTQADNMRDMVDKGRSTHGESNPSAKLKVSDILEIRASDLSSRLIAPIYGISPGHVRQIRSGNRWGGVA